jgi:hypothetical protein
MARRYSTPILTRKRPQQPKATFGFHPSTTGESLFDAGQIMSTRTTTGLQLRALSQTATRVQIATAIQGIQSYKNVRPM